MFICMCVGVCMCVFKEHHPIWKRKENKINNDNKYGGQQSRPLISSPSMQWIIFEETDVKEKREENKEEKLHSHRLSLRDHTNNIDWRIVLHPS